MPESALSAPKEKRLTGRQWFESGRNAAVFVYLLCIHLVSYYTVEVQIFAPNKHIQNYRKNQANTGTTKLICICFLACKGNIVTCVTFSLFHRKVQPQPQKVLMKKMMKILTSMTRTLKVIFLSLAH